MQLKRKEEAENIFNYLDNMNKMKKIQIDDFKKSFDIVLNSFDQNKEDIKLEI